MKKNKHGFSLIEILMVLGIMATVMTLGLSRVRRNDNNLKTVIRKMLVLVKEVRNRARLTGSTCRIVFQMGAEESTYWVESGSGRLLRETEEQKKQREDEERDRRSSGDKTKRGPTFERDAKFGKKAKSLPSGIFFGSIEVAGADAPTTSGTEFIYFSPEGFVESSIIQITDKKKITLSLVINPLTGQIDILQEAKGLKEIQR